MSTAALLVGYEVVDQTAVITLNRPEARNAQNPAMLHELDGAWQRAADDAGVKVILLRANGDHFSAGHDLKTTTEEREAHWGRDGEGLAAAYQWEHRVFFGYSRRWRDLPKPSIAAVQGACIAAGLMLCWPCDLIVASDDAYFSDPVVRMGIPGVEYHAHTWEWGPRRAKEMLFTGGRMTAAEAKEIGMVSRVVAREELDDAALELARRIAQFDGFALAQAKRVVNRTMDIIGQHAALEGGFDIHGLAHGHALSSTNNERPVLADLEAMKRGNEDT
jgi:enoyl-CoA hydratase/carnithine racemase